MSALGAPLTHHFDLYCYWHYKRGSRTMPARRDLDPVDFAQLWPCLMFVEKIEAQYHYRLIGSALTKQLGRDVTGTVVGSQFSNAPEAIAAKRTVYDRVFDTARPALLSVELGSSFSTTHNVLQLLLPLSDDKYGDFLSHRPLQPQRRGHQRFEAPSGGGS